MRRHWIRSLSRDPSATLESDSRDSRKVVNQLLISLASRQRSAPFNCHIQGASLGEKFGDPGFSTSRDPPLCLTVDYKGKQRVPNSCRNCLKDGKADIRPPRDTDSGMHSAVLFFHLRCVHSYIH